MEIYFLPPEHRQSLKGSLSKHLKIRVPPGEEWDKARKAAWKAAVREENEENNEEPGS